MGGSGGRVGEVKVGEVSTDDACPSDRFGEGCLASVIGVTALISVVGRAVTGGCARGLDGTLGETGGDKGGEATVATTLFCERESGEGLCICLAVAGVAGRF